MEIQNLDKFRDKMKWTTVTKDGRVAISVGLKMFTGNIRKSFAENSYWVEIDGYSNDKPFDLAKVEKVNFTKNVLGYTDDDDGVWPWMRSPDDILKVLVELDKLYTSKEPEPEIEKPGSMEMEHPSIEDIDFTSKKKHYSFNFQI